MEDSTSSRSSPITFDEPEPNPQPATSSASNSLQNNADGVLNSETTTITNSNDAEFGFQRAEMGQAQLVGTVQIYDRHIFLCYKTPQVWPSHVEAAEFDRLPRLLSAAMKNQKADMKKRTRLTICEGEDGTESSNGDVLIFPDMIRYRRLTHFDVDNFVDNVLVKETEWLPGAGEALTGSYIFVCAHGSRDRRCGVCGPVLIENFKEEISSQGLQNKVSVSACSHIGGHKYAGNVIIFSRSTLGEVMGHWYGYVTPDDVSILLEQHIGKGEIVDRLWSLTASYTHLLMHTHAEHDVHAYHVNEICTNTRTFQVNKARCILKYEKKCSKEHSYCVQHTWVNTPMYNAEKMLCNYQSYKYQQTLISVGNIVSYFKGPNGFVRRRPKESPAA